MSILKHLQDLAGQVAQHEVQGARRVLGVQPAAQPTSVPVAPASQIFKGPGNSLPGSGTPIPLFQLEGQPDYTSVQPDALKALRQPQNGVDQGLMQPTFRNPVFTIPNATPERKINYLQA